MNQLSWFTGITGWIKGLLRATAVICCLLFFINPLAALVADTARRDTLNRAWTNQLPEFFVTATRTREKSEEIPARLRSITAGEIDRMPANNADGLLEMLPGVNIDRVNGIFSKNASITMHGLNGTPRTLVLLDGIPLNKADGGGINWNRIIPETLDRIEVANGPTSSVYGGNAMSGVINLITARPAAKLQGLVKTFVGSCGTYGGLISLGGKTGKGERGFYYQVNGFYRQGDGYVIVPEATRTSNDVKTSLMEKMVLAKAGYQYANKSYTEVEYSYYEDKRGDGFRVFEPAGGYNAYPTHALRATSNNRFNRFSLLVSAFYQDEFYHRLSETVAAKKGNKYSLFKTDSRRIDQGLWSNLSYAGDHNMTYTLGLDLRSGSVNGADTYYTSSDVLTNKGKMDFYALFAEYEWRTLKQKLILQGGLRYDMARFHEGSFTISQPTSLTDFMAAYPTRFDDQTWQALSPRLGLKYMVSGRFNVYVLYSRGFRPPMLDDMCKNGNVTKGFKLANPQLKPETLDNFEIGCNWQPLAGMMLRPSVYYCIGHDFQYFVNTGDSINTGGDKNKPIIRRENVSRVAILGAEMALQYQLSRQVSFVASYAFNDSRVKEFTILHGGTDLTGRFIMEVPRNQFSAGVFWNNRIIQTSLTFNQRDAQWSDDENTVKTPGFNIFDLKAGHTFFKQVNLSCVVQDIFNTRYYDSKGNISPGRFFMVNVTWRFLKS
ncbi:MAG: TonB-dependent receptor [Bacteroidota bacterium]